MPHAEFLSRYRALGSSAGRGTGDTAADTRAACVKLCQGLRVPTKDCQVGATKVFMRSGAHSIASAVHFVFNT